MQEQYFPDFTFRPVQNWSIPPIILVPYDPPHKKPIRDIEVIDLRDDIGIKLIEDTESWTIPQIKREFKTLLGNIRADIKHPHLTMRGRSFTFVPREAMRPQTEEERQWLITTYGEYVKDGGAGSCEWNADGTFTLKVAYTDTSSGKDDKIAIMGHEYGHTLGKRLEPVVFEELKAYTFSNLIMKYYHNTEYRVFPIDDTNIHNAAQAKLLQLLEAGIPEEAILAHLTGEQFGEFQPDDYKKFL